MLEGHAAFHVHNKRRTIHSPNSYAARRRKARSKATTRRGRVNALRKHPFLPQALIDRLLAFTSSFGIKVILLAKAGKLIRSSRPVADMSAYCCMFYLVNRELRYGIIRYHKGKISVYDDTCCGHKKWIDTFLISYQTVAEDIKYSVLRGVIDPLVVPGLYLN